MEINAKTAAALVGQQVEFDDGLFERPLRRNILQGKVVEVKLQPDSDTKPFSDSSRHIPAHWRATVRVGAATHNLAVSYLKLVK